MSIKQIESYETTDFFEAAYLISKGNQLKKVTLLPGTLDMPEFLIEGEDVQLEIVYYTDHQGMTDGLTLKEAYDYLLMVYKSVVKKFRKSRKKARLTAGRRIYE